jgi:heme O synthase-like polyprenyltransferase
MKGIFDNIDQKKLVLAAVVVAVFGIFILALQFIIPLAGILIAFGVIGAAIYGIWKYLTGK